MRLRFLLFSSAVFICFVNCMAGKIEIPGVTHEAKAYKRVFERPQVFIQTQFYSLRHFPGGFLSRYIDQPLLFDPDIPAIPSWGKLSLPDFTATMMQMMEYKVDGVSFFPSSPGRMSLIDYLDKLPMSVKCLPNTYGWGRMVFPTPKLVRNLLKSSSALRYNGKLVMLGYTDDAYCDAEQYAERIRACRKETGDCFLIVPQLTRTSNWAKKEAREGRIPSIQKIMEEKEYIRKWLRISDGVMITPPFDDMFVVDGIRKINYRYFDEFVVTLVQSVLAEPEFAGKKLFMIGTTIGHENHYKIGYSYSHDGTRTLRHGIESALRAGADVIVMCEWDEWNENTGHCPTVYNSFSTKRIIRYYMNSIRGVKNTPLSNDDPSLPNLIFSYRKTLSLGDILKVEILNVPDGTFSGPLEINFSLYSLDGKLVRQCIPRKVYGEKLSEAVFELASEEFADYRVLLPQIEFVYNGKKNIIRDGLHFIDLRGSWNWDFKWVKQPLRDMLHPVSAKFVRSQPNLKGTIAFSGSIEVGEPLAYVQMLDNDDIIYIADSQGFSDRYREDGEYAVFHISLISRLTLNQRNGKISVVGAKTSEWVRNGVVSSGCSLPVKNITRWWNIPILLRIPKSDLAHATLLVDFPGIFQKRLSLQQIYDRFLMSWSAEKGFNLTVTGRYMRQIWVPSHLNRTKIGFNAEFIPDMPSSVVHMQAISKSGKIWRSHPVLLGCSTPKVPVLVWSNMQKKNVLCHVSADSVPVLSYDFSPCSGDILKAPGAGRACYGILGASVGAAVGRNWGPGADSTTYGWHSCNDTVMDSVPRRIQEDGEWLLDFDGKGMIAVFPHSAVPKNSAWTLSFQFRTSDVQKKQTLLVNGYPPAMNGLIQCYLQKGKVTFLYGGMTADFDVSCDMQVRPEQWNKVKLICRNDSILLEVNGKLSKSVRALSIPGRYTAVSSLGGMPGSWFKGQIKNFQINQRYQNN